MCNVAYLQMAQVAMGAVGQAQASRQNASAAIQAQSASIAGLNEQTLQFNQQQTDQMTTRSRQAMNDVGTLNAIFADSGLSGNSQDRIKNVTEGQAQTDLTTLDRNVSNRGSQATAERSAITARTQSQINSVRGPSVLGTGLQIAAIGASEYDRQHPKKPGA